MGDRYYYNNKWEEKFWYPAANRTAPEWIESYANDNWLDGKNWVSDIDNTKPELMVNVQVSFWIFFICLIAGFINFIYMTIAFIQKVIKCRKSDKLESEYTQARSRITSQDSAVSVAEHSFTT